MSFSNDNPACPRCDAVQEMAPSCDFWLDSQAYEIKCASCGLDYEATAAISVVFHNEIPKPEPTEAK